MNFKSLGIIDQILKALELSGYKKPSNIQKDTIPLLLAGKDVLGSAQTGTGKTAAFAIPIIQKIYEQKVPKSARKIEALILTPTRELAIQIHDNVKMYSKYINIVSTTIYGGIPQKRQEEALKRGVDVVIATPGRLLDLINQGIIHLKDVKYVVLDEADQMLDMGFIKDVLKIIDKTPKQRQTMLFSATMPKQIETLSNQILKDPVRVAVSPVHQTLDVITQSVYMVPKAQKANVLNHLIKSLDMKSVLVFTRTKHGANGLVKKLMNLDVRSEAIHGNKSQSARERALLNFKAGHTKVLVATDIAARGIDIDSLDYVINFDLPEVPETYIHRIGRTGRAGLSGTAISLVDPAEIKLLNQIEKHMNKIIEVSKNPYASKNEEAVTTTKSKNQKDNHKKTLNKDPKVPDYLKFRDHKPKKKKKTQDKSFIEYQKKTKPHYQTKKSNKSN